MHKNQLQELAQRSGHNLPAYAATREGPDHAPKFKAAVTFNGETFESPGFFVSLRQAEHAAAEVALKSFAQRGPSPAAAIMLDETGVCKNLLQETSQRAGVPLPNYITTRTGPGHLPVFASSVEIAGLTFHGETARTKKQAEKNAALVAWATLKQHAGRSQASVLDATEASDEQEQMAIARVMANAHRTNAIRSSPAVLSQGSFGYSETLIPSSSLPDMVHSGAKLPSLLPLGSTKPKTLSTAAPMYVPRHVNISCNSGSSCSSGRGSSTRTREVTIRETTYQADNSAPILPLPTFAMHDYHSSPAMGSTAPSYVRRGCSRSVGTSSGSSSRTSSVPNFPTQSLEPQSMLLQPGIGLPSTATAHRPAYIPRSARNAVTSSIVAKLPATLDDEPSSSADAAWGPPEWSGKSSVTVRSQSLMASSTQSSNTGVSGTAASIWSSEQTQSVYWMSSSSAASSLSSLVKDSGEAKQCRTELEELEVSEADARQLLSHLCL